MKKLLLLIPAILLALAINAEPIGPNNSETTVTDVLAAAISAASANDVIELSDGIYKEAGSDLMSIAKSLTIQAAEGAHPVIAQKCYFVIASGAQVTFKGIKFDGSIYGANDHSMRAHDASNGSETLTLIDCEFTNYPNYIIYTQKDSRRWDAITIRNCYFHHNTKSAVLITYSGEHQTCNSLAIENSTFADFTGNDYGVIYYGAPDADHTTSLSVDHCTFYNNKLQAIQWKKSTNLTITNCIFAQPAMVSSKSVYCEGGSITKCLSYNSEGYSSAATTTGNITGNPYFVNANADNYDFSITSISPAYHAGTDGKNLGDYVRWTSDASAHPTTQTVTAADDAISAAVAAAWPGDKIILSAGTYNESKSIALNKNLTVKAANDANVIVKPAKDFAISNGANVTIKKIKFDGTNQTVANFNVTDNGANHLTIDSCEFYSFNQKVVSVGSSSHLDACAISNCYFHDGTNTAISMEKTSKDYNACDDLAVTNSTFANFSGFNLPLIAFSNRDETKHTPANEDAKLLVEHCTFYNFTKTAAENNTYGFIDSRQSANTTISNCIMANPTAQDLLPSGTHNPKASQTYGGTVTNCLRYNVPEHRATPTNPIVADPLFTDAANGDFTLKRSYITGEISPAYGAGTEGSTIGDPRWETEAVYPTTDFSGMGYDFEAVDASLSGNILLETGGPNDPYLRYYHAYDPGTAEWIIKVTRPCYVVAIVNMADNTWNYDSSDAERKYFQNHKHLFAVEIFDSENNSVGSVADVNDNDGDGHDTPYPTFPLPESIYIPEAGVYTVRLSNNRHESRCGVASVTLKYTGGLTIAIPDTLKPIDALLSAKAFVDQTGAVDSIKFSTTNSDVPNQWAKWKISVPKDGTYSFAAHVKSSNRHNYRLTIKSADESSTIATFYGPNDNSGERVITFDDVDLSGSTNYVVMIQDTVKWSYGRVMNVFVSRPISLSELEENKTETAATIDEYDDGIRVDAQLERSLVAGMYNTICLPFAVSASEVERVFGAAKIIGLTSSSIEEGDFVLNLNFDDVTEMVAGTPYLIKPAANISNPKFLGVTINNTLHNVETDRVDFIGNFVAGTIPAGEDNLFLGANDMLYFSPTQDMPILGMRAYFNIHDVSAGAVRRARIVAWENVVTEIEFTLPDDTNTPNSMIQKRVENGQLLIIREGATYNAFGVRIR